MNKPKDLNEVIKHFQEQEIENPKNSAEQFYYYYESVGWMRGKSPIKNWKACVRTWMLKGTFKKVKKVEAVIDRYKEEVNEENLKRIEQMKQAIRIKLFQ